MKNIIMISLMVFSFGIKAKDYKNPYINKNLVSHSREFLIYEVVSDFHKAIDKYNAERKKSPEILSVNNHYEISDGKNLVAFDINLVLKGKFIYNGFSTNLNKQKLPKTSYLNFLINDAQAGEAVVGNVLLAALLSVDEGFKEFNFAFFNSAQNTESVIQMNWDKIKERIAKYQNSCEEIKNSVLAKSDLEQIEKLLQVMDTQQGKEADVLKDALSFVSPDCQEQFSKQTAKKTGKARAKFEADNLMAEGFEVCSQLNRLKDCILQVPPYHMSTSTKGRGYFKERTDQNDNLKQFGNAAGI